MGTYYKNYGVDGAAPMRRVFQTEYDGHSEA